MLIYNSIVEAYTFNFDYNNGTVPSMTLSDRLGNVNLSLNKGQSSSNGAHPTPSEVKASIMVRINAKGRLGSPQ